MKWKKFSQFMSVKKRPCKLRNQDCEHLSILENFNKDLNHRHFKLSSQGIYNNTDMLIREQDNLQHSFIKY